MIKNSLDSYSHLGEYIISCQEKNGAIAWDGEKVVKSKAFRVRAVDTTGAGDMFAGTFLYCVSSGKNLDLSAKFANLCAAKVVEQYGPRLEQEELVKIKRSFGK